MNGHNSCPAETDPYGFGTDEIIYIFFKNITKYWLAFPHIGKTMFLFTHLPPHSLFVLLGFPIKIGKKKIINKYCISINENFGVLWPHCSRSCNEPVRPFGTQLSFFGFLELYVVFSKSYLSFKMYVIIIRISTLYGLIF